MASLVPGIIASSGFMPGWAGTPTADARVGQAEPIPGQLPPYAFLPYGNGLALTPPMGWNGYNHFGHAVTADLVKAIARTLVSTGMKNAGYTYVNLDGGWNLRHRSPAGELLPDPAKFPQGIRPLADYVHSLGLKFGIYLSAGFKNCAATSAGGYGHYQQDAQMFAAWDVDYVKLDWCYLPVKNYPHMSRQELGFMLARRMGEALVSTGRHILLDINDYTDDRPWTWAPDLGNMWRTASDIQDNYRSVVSNFIRDMSHYEMAGPDHWNDPDMLEIGNGGMSANEYRTQFSLWAELAAPLIAGNDLTRMSGETLGILMNADGIAVDQDPLGRQGYPVANARGLWVLTKPLASGARAIVLFDQGNKAAFISTTVGDIGLTGQAQYMLRNLWDGSVSTTTGKIRALVPAHGVVMYLVTPIQ